MNNFEVAQIRQLTIHELMDTGLLPKNFNWRLFSLHKNYEYRSAPEHGTGYYSVHVVTGVVCDCVMEWDKDGQVLLCTKCLIDGT